MGRRPALGEPGLRTALWATFFLPGFTVTLGWILLLDPEYGLIDTVLGKLPSIGHGPLSTYSPSFVEAARRIDNGALLSTGASRPLSIGRSTHEEG